MEYQQVYHIASDNTPLPGRGLVVRASVMSVHVFVCSDVPVVTETSRTVGKGLVRQFDTSIVGSASGRFSFQAFGMTRHQLPMHRLCHKMLRQASDVAFWTLASKLLRAHQTAAGLQRVIIVRIRDHVGN